MSENEREWMEALAGGAIVVGTMLLFCWVL
jgi:hypothetical protein